MKIKDIHIKKFGPYEDWEFTPSEAGVQLLYGPNESGKSTLLEAMRGLLFGWKSRSGREGTGYMTLSREGKLFHLGRNGKKLDFYPLGESNITAEPADLWWHGLDRKTYERIFALTLEDMQGVNILSEVEVRTRFFGADGGEKLSHTVKDIEKAAGDLLVASANGKRKINLLMEKLKQSQSRIAGLAGQEESFRELKQRLAGLSVTEKELQERLQQWREYLASIDLVLRAWDTYKRAEEAKVKLNSLADTSQLERDAFAELDREITQCREHMRIWRGKEEGLTPENFSPDSPLGLYGQDIENLYQQLTNWEQLRKECRQGDDYLQKVREQLALSRKLHTTWRDDMEMPAEVNWYEGEMAAQKLRSANEACQQWRYREPVCPVEIVGNHTLKTSESELELQGQGLEEMGEVFRERSRNEQELAGLNLNPPRNMMWNISALVMALSAAGVYSLGRIYLPGNWLGSFILFAAAGAAAYAYGRMQSSRYGDRKMKLTEAIRTADGRLLALDRKYNLGIPQSDEDMRQIRQDYEGTRKAYYSQDVELAKLHAYEQQRKRWEEEGEALTTSQAEAQSRWKAWLPKAASGAVTSDDFFGMKQEYDQYLEQQSRYQGYEKRLEEHKEQLAALEEAAKELWGRLDIEGEPSTIELRRLYNSLKLYQQNKIRWEQKESQRKNFREEYDQWNRKEKDLLIRQEELLQKSGVASAGEYRQRLLRQDQYKQWETIYRQSQIQLNLLAPRKETYELLCRRLKEGNKNKWLDEHDRSSREIEGLEQQLALLYESRGEITETMRSLSGNQDMAAALQEKQQLEEELTEALEDWTTQVLISHFINQAQQTYEKEKQPQVLEIASSYLKKMTGGRYRLDPKLYDEGIYLLDEQNERVEAARWSSGLADQVYLALRLSLARRFGRQVEPLPVILDDILLRFDETRQREALALLADIGREEQLWLFTCQEQLLRLALEMNSPDLHAWRLSTAGVKAC